MKKETNKKIDLIFVLFIVIVVITSIIVNYAIH